MSRLKFFEEPASAAKSVKSNSNLTESKPDLTDSETAKFPYSAKYRCEQFNTTKVEDSISFHCNVKKQYQLDLDPGKNAYIKLEQYLYKINPEALGDALAATEALEYDKENVLFKLYPDNSIQSIGNFQEIQQKWEQFKPTLINSSFYRSLASGNPAVASGLIQGGDLEFGTEDNLKKTYEKALFIHVVLNDFDPLKDRDHKQVLQFNSQIFVDIPLELELTHGVIQENDTNTEIMTVGRLNKSKLDEAKLKEQYNNFYKPIIEYDFTEYNYEYIIRRTINNKSGLIINASARLTEAVKYNYQFLTQFDLKMLED